MSSVTKRLRTGFLNYLSQANGLTFGKANITIFNQAKVHIENHSGLITYNSNQLIVKVNHGLIEINGSSFILKMLLKEEVFLEGKIDQINFINDI